MTSIEILREARDHMAKYGKCEKRLFSDAGIYCKVCMWGAVSIVTRTHTLTDLVFSTAANALYAAADAKCLDQLFKFSDTHSKDECLAVFDKAIAGLEKP